MQVIAVQKIFGPHRCVNTRGGFNLELTSEFLKISFIIGSEKRYFRKFLTVNRFAASRHMLDSNDEAVHSKLLVFKATTKVKPCFSAS